MEFSEVESHCYVRHTFNMLRYVDCHKCVKDILTQSKDIEIPKAHSIRELIANSDEMGLRFPNERFRLRNQPPSNHPSIEEEASSVYPFVFENVFVLYCRFLEHKLKYGSEIEKSIYSGMKIEDFVERLLVKRCVSFFGKKNRFLLRTGEIGNDNFKLIGTDDEEPPLVMRDYLTLDEIKLASFISISSRSKNQVTIGICSLQLDKKGLMDYQDIILGKSQNCQENGYGPKPKKNCSEEMEKNFHKRSLWNDFYSHKSSIYGHINKKGVQRAGYRSPKTLKSFVKIEGTTEVCDCSALEKRYSSIIFPLLIESNSRAKKYGKMAYIWINRNRLGLANMTQWQEEYFFRIFATVALAMFTRMNSVFCIHFENFTENCWIKNNSLLNNNNVDDPYFWNKHPNKGIIMRFSSETISNDASRKDDDYLHITTYTASPNSFPGNEYWMKKISSNKDSTSYLASHSFIAELHNPLVNSRMVSGKNLHIAMEYDGLMHISEYSASELENRYKYFEET